MGAILPTFCPTDPHRAAQTRITLNSQSAESPADQGKDDSDESCRTVPDELHPAENRKPSQDGACFRRQHLRRLDLSCRAATRARGDTGHAPVDPVVVRELTACTSLHDREVIEQVDGPVVQPHMIVKAQVQVVLGDVRAEMRPAGTG